MEYLSLNETLSIPSRVDQLRIAGILDELSGKFFPYECEFVNLDERMWEEQINLLKPHILFVESVWNGHNKTWRGKFSGRSDGQLVKIVNWCNKRKIPTIFWNKEDPIHTFTFLGAAFLFDYVFTTDMDCVPLYKRLLGHNRVGVLPFATSVQLFHPIETYQRKDAACFAGSYYARREERRLDFDNIADVLIENYALDIYDRNPYPDNPDYTFPKRFQPHILGTLPVNEIDIAYKSYKLGITLNVVKHSSTMEARRIFELLSCNTLTASNPCLGIKNLFGDLVIQSEDSSQFANKIRSVLNDESTYHKLRLLALRKTLQEHTYKERLEYLYHKVFGVQPAKIAPKLAVFALVNTPHDIAQVKGAFDRQGYMDKQLFLFANSQEENINSSEILHPIEQYQAVLQGDWDYYVFFSPRHYYGKNYLEDLALATRYAEVSVYGKSAHFTSSENEIHYQEELGSYYLIDRLRADRSMFSQHLLHSTNLTELAQGWWFENVPCISIDAYNFCENYGGESCTVVDDLKINTGITMEDLYRISDKLRPEQNNYSLGKRLTGEELCLDVSPQNDNFRFELLPLGRFGFYTLNRTPRIYIGPKVDLQDLTLIEELTGKPMLRVVNNSYIEGGVIFHINFYGEDDTFLGSYGAAVRACTSLPVPDQARYCKLSITASGSAYGMVKEFLFGPRVLTAIRLPIENNE